MTQYTIGIPNFLIQHTRSGAGDTLAASMGLRVMNAEGGLHHQWNPQSMFVGTYASGGPPVAIDFFYPNVDVPDPTPDSPDGGAVYWSFLLVNADHPDYGTLVDALTSAADGVAGALLGSQDLLAIILGGGILGADALIKLLTQSCDGIVTAQNWAWTAAELANMTAGNTNWLNGQNYTGTAGPIGCDAPNYTVTYEVSSGPAVGVPNLNLKAWRDAVSIAHQVGLGIQVIRYVTSPSVDVPTVEYQIPTANSLVPRGTIIEVIVGNPPKIRP